MKLFGYSSGLTASLLLTSSLVSPTALAQSASLDNTCSKLMYIGENNIYGLDLQAFVSEADGRDRIRLSSQTRSRILADDIYSALWMSDGRAVLDGGWILNADGTGLRDIPYYSEFVAVAPNARKLVAYDNGITVYSPNGKLLASASAIIDFDGDIQIPTLTWASTSQAMAWVEAESSENPRNYILVVADGLAQNAVMLATSQERIVYEWAPDGSKIVYSDGVSVSVANADGTSSAKMPNSLGRSPTWSPDGSRIAWINGSSIVVANADLSNMSTIASGAIGPSVKRIVWSPDNRSIAWTNDTTLQIIRSSGGTPKTLPTGNNVSGGVRFNFSPDASRLAWTTDNEIWVSNGDGTKARRSYTSEGQGGFDDWQEVFTARTADGEPPYWSPDSTVFANVLSVSEILVSNADGSAHKPILGGFDGWPFEWYEISVQGWSPCIFEGSSPGPDNDDLATAEYVPGVSDALASDTTLTVFGSTVGATSEINEFPHGGRFPNSWFEMDYGARNSIWYRWSVESDQVVEIDTVGSAVGTAMAVYTGGRHKDLELVASMDDRSGESRIRFAARSGQTYQLALDSYKNFVEGDVQLNFRQPTMDPSECTITGTDGPDELTGTKGADVICALGGDDKIKGLGGADLIFAGEGNDLVSASGGNDMVFGEGGKDVIAGGSGTDILVGGTLADRIFGGSGGDTMLGGAGADQLYGAGGNDVLLGGGGADRLFGGNNNDVLDGGSFRDRCSGGAGDDTFANCEKQ